MATSSSAIFSGQSTFSSDFQTVLSRAVSIASLPIGLMQNNVALLTAKQQTLQGMQNQFNNLQSALQGVVSAMQGTVAGISSQPMNVTAAIQKNALPGTYSIQVDDIGSSTTTLSNGSLTKVADPTTADISASSNFTLTVNDTPYQISPTGTSLVDLANAINASSAPAHATIINLGSSSSPDYRLAVNSDNLGGDTIQLNDGTNDLLDNVRTGTPALYEVNGSTAQLTSTSTQVSLSPGLTVNLLQPTTSGVPATITVSSTYSSLQTALQNFATAYNSAVDAVATQRGSNSGALNGESTVFALKGILQNISQYTNSGTGAVSNLTGMGLDLDSSGHLNFNASEFTGSSIASVQQFLGSTGDSGSGFLQLANNALNSVTDSDTGLLQSNITTLTAQITTVNKQISSVQARVNDLQTNLQAQLSAADAAIATLQAQKSYFTSLFQATYLSNSSNGLGG